MIAVVGEALARRGDQDRRCRRGRRAREVLRARPCRCSWSQTFGVGRLLSPPQAREGERGRRGMAIESRRVMDMRSPWDYWNESWIGPHRAEAGEQVLAGGDASCRRGTTPVRRQRREVHVGEPAPRDRLELAACRRRAGARSIGIGDTMRCLQIGCRLGSVGSVDGTSAVPGPIVIDAVNGIAWSPRSVAVPADSGDDRRVAGGVDVAAGQPDLAAVRRHVVGAVAGPGNGCGVGDSTSMVSGRSAPRRCRCRAGCSW